MSVHEEVLKSMKQMSEKFSSAGVVLELPPQSSLTFGTEYIAVDMGKSLTARVQFNPKFTNPLKMYQGGMLCGAIDEVFGPLIYMAAEKPVVTIEMSTSYVRPFKEEDEYIEIRAEVVSKSKSLLVLRGEVKTKEGKLIATASSHSLVVSDQNLKK